MSFDVRKQWQPFCGGFLGQVYKLSVTELEIPIGNNPSLYYAVLSIYYNIYMYVYVSIILCMRETKRF